MIWNGKNRVTEELAKMAKEATARRAKFFTDNLNWEIARLEWTQEELRKKVSEALGKEIHEDTVGSWFDNGTGNPTGAHRKAIAQALGLTGTFSDGKSLTDPKHIELRTRQLGLGTKPKPRSSIDSSMSQILVAVEQSADSNPEKTAGVIEEVLSSPYAPYLTIAAYLLKAKLVFAEIDRQP